MCSAEMAVLRRRYSVRDSYRGRALRQKPEGSIRQTALLFMTHQLLSLFLPHVKLTAFSHPRRQTNRHYSLRPNKLEHKHPLFLV